MAASFPRYCYCILVKYFELLQHLGMKNQMNTQELQSMLNRTALQVLCKAMLVTNAYSIAVKLIFNTPAECDVSAFPV